VLHHAGDLRAERLCDLHCERPTPPEAPLIKTFCRPQSLLCPRTPCNAVDARDVNRSRLFKTDASGFQCDCALGSPTYIFGKRAASPAENFIASFELRNVFADRFNDPGKNQRPTVCPLVSSAQLPNA